MIEIKESPIGLQRFRESIPGIKVEGRVGVIKVTKISEQITVPELVLIALDEVSLSAFRRFTNSRL